MNTTSTPHSTCLIVDLDVERGRAVGEASGLDHRVVPDLRRARAELAHAPDVLVAHARPAGEDTLSLVRELAERDALPLTVLWDEDPEFDACRSAWRCGVADFVASPGTPRDLAEHVLTHLRERSANARLDDGLHLCVRSGPEAPRYLAREACAFALRHGAAPAARARLGSTVHELALNSCRHAYGETPGEVRLRLECDGEQLRARLSDRGTGFDADRARLDGVPSPLTNCFDVPGGLARVASLVESLKLASSEVGTVVDFVVSFHGASFDSEVDMDFSELDWFDTERCKQVLRAVQRNDHDSLLSLPPALAVVLGRLLAGSTADRIAHETLWS